MKKLLLMLFIGCTLFTVSCSKEEETDQLANTSWQSGKYDENTTSASAYGAIYYGDASSCRELLEFDEIGYVWRYITYHGEKVHFDGSCEYEINDNTLVISEDTTHTYQLTNETTITTFFLSGKEDGTFTKL